MRRGAAARQPGHDLDRGAEPARVRAPLSNRPPVPARGDRAGARDGEADRSARLPCRQALGRDAPAIADRSGARASPAARADGRADRRSRPTGTPGALGAHRRASERGHDDPDVDALHRGGRATGGYRADHVARQRGGRRLALGAREGARRTGGARGLRPARPARRGRGEAGAAGLRTRRTGTSISILGVDAANGLAIDGDRRPANLEDVFVLLTGEEIG